MVSCPKCKAALEIKQFPAQAQARVRCGRCGAGVALEITVRATLLPDAAGVIDWSTVLVAVEGEATQEMIREVLTDGGLKTVSSMRGTEALDLLEQRRPGIVIVDVGLPEILGFEFVDILKKREEFRDVGIVLLASIYDKTRYKREPDSLYGADDYVERHHIGDQLLAKVQQILARKGPGAMGEGGGRQAAAPAASAPPMPMTEGGGILADSRGLRPPVPPRRVLVDAEAGGASLDRTVVDQVARDQARPATAGRTAAPAAPRTESPRRPVGDPDQHEAAKRIARIIISDVALYNQKLVEQGLANGNLRELLRDELAEGERHYEGRVAAEIRSETRYFEQALEDFIAKRMAARRGR